MYTKQSNIKTLLLATLFAVISLILTRFLGFYLPFLNFNSVRISLGNVPLILCGLFLGPMPGAVSGILADLLGGTLFPSGPYFPGFTLTACLCGFLPGLLKKYLGEPKLWIHIALIVFATETITSILLNTLWLSILYGAPYFSLLIPRIPITIGLCLIYSVLIWILYRRLKKEIF